MVPIVIARRPQCQLAARTANLQGVVGWGRSDLVVPAGVLLRRRPPESEQLPHEVGARPHDDRLIPNYLRASEAERNLGSTKRV